MLDFPSIKIPESVYGPKSNPKMKLSAKQKAFLKQLFTKKKGKTLYDKPPWKK